MQHSAQLQLLSVTVIDLGELGTEKLSGLSEPEQELSPRHDPLPICRVFRPPQLSSPAHEPFPTLPLYEKQLNWLVHDPFPMVSRPALLLLMVWPVPDVEQLELPVQLLSPALM